MVKGTSEKAILEAKWGIERFFQRHQIYTHKIAAARDKSQGIGGIHLGRSWEVACIPDLSLGRWVGDGTLLALTSQKQPELSIRACPSSSSSQ